MIDTAPEHSCGVSVKTAVIILFHGSRAEGAGDVVRRITSEVRQRGGYDLVEEAFLRHAKPTLMDAIQRCVELQAEKIVIVPFFLQLGTHVTADIPGMVEEARKRYPQTTIDAADAVGLHPLMADIVLDLVEKAKR